MRSTSSRLDRGCPAWFWSLGSCVTVHRQRRGLCSGNRSWEGSGAPLALSLHPSPVLTRRRQQSRRSACSGVQGEACTDESQL